MKLSLYNNRSLHAKVAGVQIHVNFPITNRTQRRYVITVAGTRKSADRCTISVASAARTIIASTLPILLSGAVLLSSSPGFALPLAQELKQDHDQYERLLQKRSSHKPASNLPSAEEARALLQLSPDLFTDDAWKGMVRLKDYGQYVDDLQDKGVEGAPGCEECTNNRLILEKAWQVVANEFYDPRGHFSQADWADQLIRTLKEHNGVLRTKRDLYQAGESMLKYLGDRYSNFLPPQQFRQALRRPLPAQRNYLAAQFIGVGVQLDGIDAAGGRIVAAPLAGSPAEDAGVVQGDRIMEIDGMAADQFTMDETAALLRGPEGSSVELTVASKRLGGRLRTLRLDRRPLPQPAIKEARLPLPGGRSVSYIRLHYFSSDATEQLRKAVLKGEVDGVDGYIVDLRNNPGGTFEEAISMSTMFLDKGLDVVETVRNENVVDVSYEVGHLSREVFPMANIGPITHSPLVLLVNHTSASASEVLAGALHDNSRALLVGEKTFGKGVLQYYFPMPDGSGLKLTVAKYLTPDRYDISQQGGLRPDVACDDFPHGVMTRGTADRCVLLALDAIQSNTWKPSPRFNPVSMFASTVSGFFKR